MHSKWDITDNEFIVVAESKGIAFEMALEFVKGVVPEKAIEAITIPLWKTTTGASA